jgi:putative copper export protein
VDSFLVRFLASLLIDFSLAALAGLLLARRWIGKAPNGTALIPLAIPAGGLVFGLALQLLSLVATFTGQSGLPGLLTNLPDIGRTHAGSVLCLTLTAAILLLLVSMRYSLRNSFAVAALACCLLFRSGSGHSATEALVSLTQTLQFVHLASMAIWSGGVLVSGFLVMPRLVAESRSVGAYLAALSRWSTWAVVLVALTGLCKAYLITSSNIPQALGTKWGFVLGLKICSVGAAVILGFLNRRLVSHLNRSMPTQLGLSVALLRAEAIAMTIILIASAALANLPPPGE